MTSAKTDTLTTAAPQLTKTAGAPQFSTITFTVSRKQLLVRLIKNKIYGFLTFGIYRFWAKTHVRRILWHGVSIENDRLEYLGLAKELFIGFLIAMIILMPIMMLAGLVTDILTVAGSELLFVGQFLNFILLYLFWQFARYRLWRYRLSRTSWRGIRFFLLGKGFKYAFIVTLWTVVVAVTLGWAYPWLQAFRLNYQLNNTQFGDTGFTYQGTAWGLFKIYWPAILIAQVVIAIAIIGLYSSNALDILVNTSEFQGKDIFSSDGNAGWILLGAGLIVFLVLSLLSFAVRVWEFRYLIEKTSFETATFTSDLTVRSVISIILLLLVLGLVGYLGVAAAVIFLINTASELAVFILLIGIFVGYVVFDILKMLYLIVPLVSAVCRSLKIENFEAFEHAAASARKSPKYGEGFADAMDVGAF
jgi:uncharacterized membrane protein YjgN (DUF898 family)